jgi:hypothetical protein
MKTSSPFERATYSRIPDFFFSSCAIFSFLGPDQPNPNEYVDLDAVFRIRINLVTNPDLAF